VIVVPTPQPKPYPEKKPEKKPKKGGSEEAASETQATIIVQVPEGARLYLDGLLSDRTSTTRTYITPDLPSDKDFSYTLKMETTEEGKAETASKRVIVRAGAVTRVDFTDRNTASTIRPDEEPAPAHVTVRAPEDARLRVDGVVCPLTSGTRTFDTPELEPGRKYFYTLTAEVVRDGRPVSESRRVVLQAGKDVQVDFLNMAAVAAASR
jgi:uncharacterized protein (TIGR03000 family)